MTGNICVHGIYDPASSKRKEEARLIQLSNTPAVELINVTKRFGKVVANDHVDLTVNKGEILSLLGENGSG